MAYFRPLSVSELCLEGSGRGLIEVLPRHLLVGTEEDHDRPGQDFNRGSHEHVSASLYR
jgi:hypothetical protein